MAQLHQAPISLAFTHAGLTVTDMEHAISWYQDVIGAQLIWGPLTFSPDDEKSRDICRDIFGEKWNGMRLAQAVLSNGVGIELMEFISPASERRQTFDYWKTGCSHIGISTTDIFAMAARIEKTGGRQISQIWELFPKHLMCYCEDPFGNVIELYNASFEQFFANRANEL